MKDKLFLVLDTWVIARASSEEREEAESILKAQHVLQEIYHQCHIVVLDLAEPESQIWEEWKRYLFRSFITRVWYAEMNSSGKWAWANKEQLQLSNFPDPDNEKFVQVAVTLPQKLVITGDEELINWGQTEEARNLGVEIWSIEEALEKL